ncbi:hypothetical protein AA0X95_13285 [Bacillus sp. 1P10SD]|uniref:hypothetical protein n=1 Tax=Bacillus sp. 1P10SD TaxID=3132265 RepID=UPI0039A5C49B
MPRGKELEQLPVANIAPTTGKDVDRYNKEVLGGIVPNDQPQPSDIDKENEDMV